MKKKLLIFHPTIAPYRIDFFNRLYEVFNARICLQYWNLKDQKFDYKKIYEQFEFQPIYLPENSTLAICKNVWQQINNFQPDILLTCEFGFITLTAILAKLLLRKKMKLVVMTDDSYDMVVGGKDFSYRHRNARRMLASHIDDFIVVEPRVEQWFKRHYGKGIWFPIIVDETKAISNYKRILPLSRQLTERYNLVEKQVLLSVSRLVDLKNLHRVIDAFAQVKTDAVLVIVGDGPDREALELHAKQTNKHIIFTGRFDGDELYAWYNLASVFILASYQEPFGAVTNEALLAGCRVVISKKAGSLCLVTENNGELIDPMNVSDIVSAIDHQFSKACVPNFKTSRESLMNISFEREFASLVCRLNSYE